MLGVDLSSSSVLRASQVYSMVIKANCVRLPLMDQSVDAVISSFLLEHLECAEFEQFFREMARILRPDGCMVHYLDLEDNSRFTQWAKQQAWYHRLFVVERGHYSLRPIEEWRTCFQKAGFQAEKERYSCKTWIQDPSIWSRLADPAVAQPYRSIGRVSRGLSRVLGPALNVAVDLYQDTVERFYPHSWASKAIWVLKPTLSSLSK